MTQQWIKETSQDPQDLLTWMQTNNQYGSNDLGSFILEKLQLSVGERVLDIGCGTGQYTVQFAHETRTPGSVVGIDRSEESLAHAKALAQREGTQVEFLQRSMDVLQGLFPANHFDVITAIYALYYSSNTKALLQELQRILKPSGRLAVVGPYGDNNKGWFDFLQSFVPLPENILYNSSAFMDAEVLPFAARQFTRSERFDFVNPIAIPSFDALKDYWLSNTYYDPRHDAAFEKAAKAHFARHGTFTFHKRALMVVMKGKLGA
jgi:ubiquinone/menaquinone biosynthesis C-methylase UbiE